MPIDGTGSPVERDDTHEKSPFVSSATLVIHLVSRDEHVWKSLRTRLLSQSFVALRGKRTRRFLGCLNCSAQSKGSVCNAYGKQGSQYSTDSFGILTEPLDPRTLSSVLGISMRNHHLSSWIMMEVLMATSPPMNISLTALGFQAYSD